MKNEKVKFKLDTLKDSKVPPNENQKVKTLNESLAEIFQELKEVQTVYMQMAVGDSVRDHLASERMAWPSSHGRS